MPRYNPYQHIQRSRRKMLRAKLKQIAQKKKELDEMGMRVMTEIGAIRDTMDIVLPAGGWMIVAGCLRWGSTYDHYREESHMPDMMRQAYKKIDAAIVTIDPVFSKIINQTATPEDMEYMINMRHLGQIDVSLAFTPFGGQLLVSGIQLVMANVILAPDVADMYYHTAQILISYLSEDYPELATLLSYGWDANYHVKPD